MIFPSILMRLHSFMGCAVDEYDGEYDGDGGDDDDDDAPILSTVSRTREAVATPSGSDLLTTQALVAWRRRAGTLRTLFDLYEALDRGRVDGVTRQDLRP